MDTSAAIEVIVLRNGENETKSNGLTRTVTFLLPNDGDHPFKGMIGERLHIVPVRIADDETPGMTPGVGGEDLAALPASPPSPRQPVPGEYEKRRLAEMPLAQQCALRCREPAFQEYLSKRFEEPDVDADVAGQIVRDYCDITSRRDFTNDASARYRWGQLETDFLQAAGRMATDVR